MGLGALHINKSANKVSYESKALNLLEHHKTGYVIPQYILNEFA